jgi:hypothetical protein
VAAPPTVSAPFSFVLKTSSKDRSEYQRIPVPPQNLVDRTLVDVSTLGVKLA